MLCTTSTFTRFYISLYTYFEQKGKCQSEIDGPGSKVVIRREDKSTSFGPLIVLIT